MTAITAGQMRALKLWNDDVLASANNAGVTLSLHPSRAIEINAALEAAASLFSLDEVREAVGFLRTPDREAVLERLAAIRAALAQGGSR